MTKIRTRTYIKLCKGRRVLTQYVQKKEEKPRPPPPKKNPLYKRFLGAHIVSKACYSQTRPITLHTEKLLCVFG